MAMRRRRRSSTVRRRRRRRRNPLFAANPRRRRRRRRRNPVGVAANPRRRRRRRRRNPVAAAANPRRRRRRRRNSWWKQPVRHRRAAYLGIKRKKSRRRRRNRGYSYNPRRRRRRRTSTRRRRRNPARALSLRTVTRGFRLPTLATASWMVGGALGNAWLSGAVSRFLPGVLQTGPGSHITGLATAGLLGAGAGMVIPRRSSEVFLGGVLEVVTRAAKEYIIPLIPGMGSMGDYFTRANGMELQPLGDYFNRTNLQEAQPLGDYYGDSWVGEELAAV